MVLIVVYGLAFAASVAGTYFAWRHAKKVTPSAVGLGLAAAFTAYGTFGSVVQQQKSDKEAKKMAEGYATGGDSFVWAKPMAGTTEMRLLVYQSGQYAVRGVHFAVTDATTMQTSQFAVDDMGVSTSAFNVGGPWSMTNGGDSRVFRIKIQGLNGLVSEDMFLRKVATGWSFAVRVYRYKDGGVERLDNGEELRNGEFIQDTFPRDLLPPWGQ